MNRKYKYDIYDIYIYIIDIFFFLYYKYIVFRMNISIKQFLDGIST